MGKKTNKIIWMKWTTICKPKECGGFDIKDIKSSNEALLAK